MTKEEFPKNGDEERRIAEGKRRAELDAEEKSAGLGEGGAIEIPGLTEEDAARAERVAREARERRENKGQS
jgi:hypothetical protein